MWRLLFMSNGELPLERHMLEAGKRPKAGMEMRMLGIPADAGAGLGIFNTVHDKPSGEALSKHLEATTARYHGAAVVAFLERLIAERDSIAAYIPANASAFARDGAFVKNLEDARAARLQVGACTAMIRASPPKSRPAISSPWCRAMITDCP